MRSIWSYGKVQQAVARLTRDRSAFFKPIKAPVYLDIGPGPHFSPEFYNIDYQWRPGLDRCLDLSHGLRMSPQSVAGAYSEHCVEHLPVETTVRLLSELHAAMLDGAWLRVSMPDLELYARSYVESLDTRNDVTPFPGRTVGGVPTFAKALNDVIRLHGHLFVYDFDTFGRLLKAAGFKNIARCDFRQGADPKLLRDSDRRRRETLYVEAQR